MGPLHEQPNLGPTIARRLADVGVGDLVTLRRIGPAAAYRRMMANADHRLPVCYYLYSLEGALRGIDWRQLSPADKERLKRAAGVV